MTNLFRFIFIILIIGSCKKEDVNENARIIHGKVVECGTQIPLSGANINLKILKYSPVIMGEFGTYSAKTDMHGNFELKFQLSNIDKVGYIFDLNIDQNKYISECHSLNNKILKPDTTIVFSLSPETFINFHVKNSSPVNGKDKIIVFTDQGVSGWQLLGKDIDSTFIHRTNGNVYKTICWEIYKNSEKSELCDSIFCPAFEKVDFEINY